MKFLKVNTNNNHKLHIRSKYNRIKYALDWTSGRYVSLDYFMKIYKFPIIENLNLVQTVLRFLNL